jgi:hypothetical protein
MPELEFTLSFEEPDEDGWIVARVLEVPALSARDAPVRRPVTTFSTRSARC